MSNLPKNLRDFADFMDKHKVESQSLSPEIPIDETKKEELLTWNKIGRHLLVFIIGCFVLIPSMIFGFFINGFVGSILWKWFAVEVFGARPIHIWTFVGVSILITWFRRGVSTIPTPETTKEKLSLIFVEPSFILFLGYLIHLAVLHFGV